MYIFQPSTLPGLLASGKVKPKVVKGTTAKELFKEQAAPTMPAAQDWVHPQGYSHQTWGYPPGYHGQDQQQQFYPPHQYTGGPTYPFGAAPSTLPSTLPYRSHSAPLPGAGNLYGGPIAAALGAAPPTDGSTYALGAAPSTLPSGSHSVPSVPLPGAGGDALTGAISITPLLAVHQKE